MRSCTSASTDSRAATARITKSRKLHSHRLAVALRFCGYFDKIPIGLQSSVGSAACLDMQAFRHRDDFIEIDRTYTILIVFY